jgi:hypothetical protein
MKFGFGQEIRRNLLMRTNSHNGEQTELFLSIHLPFNIMTTILNENLSENW